jgi:hypothetical protein
MNSISELSVVSPYFVIIPPLEKGGEGGLQKANKDRRDMELLIIHKISPDPSLLEGELNWCRTSSLSPFGKGALIFPPFSTTLFVTEPLIS